MKLYHYDHCPYCVKARMIFGLKQVEIEVVALPNDDEATPIGLVGQKLVPILIKEDGTAMPESLDIIKYIDGLVNPIVGESKNDPALAKWMQEVRNYHYALAMPRWIKIGLPEFQSPTAVQYFTTKKEAYIGSFDKHIENTPQLIAEANKHLLELENLIQGETFFWDKLSIDDFHLFAALRCLTTTKGVIFPEKINTYMNNLSKASGVSLYWEKAI